MVRRELLRDVTGASPCGPIGQSLRCDQQVVEMTVGFTGAVCCVLGSVVGLVSVGQLR